MRNTSASRLIQDSDSTYDSLCHIRGRPRKSRSRTMCMCRHSASPIGTAMSSPTASRDGRYSLAMCIIPSASGMIILSVSMASSNHTNREPSCLVSCNAVSRNRCCLPALTYSKLSAMFRMPRMTVCRASMIAYMITPIANQKIKSCAVLIALPSGL